ncbi:MAG: undecaprenyl-diphosphate phosphatase [Desulfoprunum sp.]|jgi:undecaprenyl-diphosphatase|uniref:undecaprenyl-diphosphate phosphatase n=1 Tax=Desulfoprunum sp. TaxID=2020866 RepID=UPI000A7437A1
MTPIRSLLLLFICAGLWLGSQPPATATGEPVGQAAVGPPAMSVGQAAILGVVEGLTEYLPVSSTGHLLLAQRIMGIDGDSVGNGDQRSQDAVEAYTICIQAGAIIAVLGLYFRRVRQIFAGLAGRDPVGLRLLVNIIVGFLPAAVIGLLFNGTIKTWLFGPWPVVTAWLTGGLAILAVHWHRQSQPQTARNGVALDDLTWKMALVIGLAQCIAMWPGVSRSLITIVGGVLVGMSLPAAVEYSFLLGVLTLGGATAYDAVKHGEEMLQIFDPLSLTVGLVFAFLSAVAAIKWMVSYLNRHGMAIFGYYRVCLGLAVAVLLATGKI